MRNIIIKNEKLYKLLKERSETVLEARKLQKEVEKIQQEQVKLGYKIERYKEKMKPLVKEAEKDLEFSEFEFLANVDVEKDLVKLEIRDWIEEYTVMKREEMKKTLKEVK